MNIRRQGKVDEVLKEARELVWQQNDSSDRLLTLIGKDWSVGVIGLVAGRLVQTFHRPVAIGTSVDGKIIGSARSIGKYPIIDGLKASEKNLLTFGGHRQAAGFSLKDEDWDRYTKDLKKHARAVLSEEDLIPELTADAVLTEDEISLTTVENIEKLAPFGFGYPQPTFILSGVTLDELKIVGRNQDHLKATALLGDTYLELVGFGMAGKILTQDHGTWHLMGHLEINRWNGTERLQFRFFDYLPGEDNFEIVSEDGPTTK